ncbi:MAG: hypothetical protein JWN34_4532 [Bryobacterales bacterium]|nr:hypothetical protein [Bryobacterales bacterium]
MFGRFPGILPNSLPLSSELSPETAFAREQKVSYRPDVDGLRAVAVLLVVLDHLHTRVTGGYVGVDVFFVISGYLISKVILAELDAGRFSVANFYERRIRRIFPALFVMLAGAAVLTYLLFVPSEIDDFARSMLAALVSGSNLLFWHQAGYFDTASAAKPLLHTWSLAVEEQFYIFFPLLLVVVHRSFPRQMRATICSIALVSFLLACFYIPHHATAAFFFAPLRAWELLLGAIVSQRYVPPLNSNWKRNCAAAIGLPLILLPALFYTARTSFPGLAALPPCAGAALLIAAGETGDSVIGRMLSWRPVVFIGLISYSLYLWHWPILVFQENSYFLISAPAGSKAVKVVVFFASLLVATLSWLLVEQPFRTGRMRLARGPLLRLAAVATTLLAMVGAFAVASHGFPARFPAQALAADRFTHFDSAAAFRENVCFIDPSVTFGSAFSNFNKDVCLADDPVRKHYLLIGDSHAAHLYPGLKSVFPEINLSQATVTSCKPFLDEPAGTVDYCVDMWKYIFGDYLLHHHVDAVLMSGRWDESDFPELGLTIEWLRAHGIPVILFGPVVEFDVPLPRLLAIALRDARPGMIDAHSSMQPAATDKRLAEVARDQWNVRYVSTFEDLCDKRADGGTKLRTKLGCPVYAARDVPLLFDSDHLTPAGSILFAKAMRELHQFP